MDKGFWVAELHLLGDVRKAHSWLAIAFSSDREAVETQYRLHLLHMPGYEMRLSQPGGAVVQYHSDAPAAHDAPVSRASAHTEVLT